MCHGEKTYFLIVHKLIGFISFFLIRFHLICLKFFQQLLLFSYRDDTLMIDVCTIHVYVKQKYQLICSHVSWIQMYLHVRDYLKKRLPYFGGLYTEELNELPIICRNGLSYKNCTFLLIFVIIWRIYFDMLSLLLQRKRIQQAIFVCISYWHILNPFTISLLKNVESCFLLQYSDAEMPSRKFPVKKDMIIKYVRSKTTIL